METNSTFPEKGKPERTDTPLSKYASINPAKEPLTPTILRKLSGNQLISDEEAATIIQTINHLARIFLEIGRLKNVYCIDNQQSVSLRDDETHDIYSLIKNNAA